MSVERLAVIGTGLMGASVGLAAKRAGVERVAGFDVDSDALRAARGRGAVDVATEELRQAVEGADLVVVATPVGTISGVVAAVFALAGPRSTITDVGSTKGRICSDLAGIPSFVGGHPMCGSEASGPDNARADLFDGATWFLTSLSGADRGSQGLVTEFVTSIGAVPVDIDPRMHDRLVALVSHLPHALANLLVTQVGAAEIEGVEARAVAGASFRDMTRVAGANPRVWSDVFLENGELLAAALAEYRDRVEELETMVRTGDREALLRSIEEAAAHRARPS